MYHRISAFGFGLLLVGTITVGAGTPVDDARENLQQWVATRQLTARLQADWRSQKEMLEQTVALYEKELENLNDQLTRTDTSTQQVDAERAKLEAENQELEEARAKAGELATRFEKHVRALASAFPPPLTIKLEPLMKQIPDDPVNARVTPVERMQNLVGILNEVDKFNSSVWVESELQKRPSGEELQVKTLYVGLGQAYFADKTGEFAGVGIPSSSGWQWEEKPGLGNAVLRCIAVYENTQPPAFVELPMTVN